MDDDYGSVRVQHDGAKGEEEVEEWIDGRSEGQAYATTARMAPMPSSSPITSKQSIKRKFNLFGH